MYHLIIVLLYLRHSLNRGPTVAQPCRSFGLGFAFQVSRFV
jgi:hypothetical protein